MNGLSRKTILVTGATGFIGQHLVNRLMDIPETHLILVSRKTHISMRKGITWIKSSLNQLTPTIWQEHEIKKIDMLFHLGAFTPKKNDGANQNIEEIYRDNLLGTKILLESLPNAPQRIVFSSTLDVYAHQSGRLELSEVSPLDPSSLYGASKLFCEQVIKYHARQHGIGYAILRYGHIFGPGEDAYQKLIPQTIRQLLDGKPPVLYGDGSAERDFLFVSDVVEATLRAAVSNPKELGPINIVKGESKPILDIVKILVQITKFPGNIQFVPEKSSGYSLRFDNSKMREVLGDWKFVSLEDGLRQEVEYFRRLM